MGKSSISMGHGFHGYVSHNHRVTSHFPTFLSNMLPGHEALRASSQSARSRPYLVGGIPTPLKNMSSSIGMIIPNIWKGKKC